MQRIQRILTHLLFIITLLGFVNILSCQTSSSGLKQAKAELIPIWKKKCEDGSAPQCLYVASMYEKENPEKYLYYLNLGCKKGGGTACMLMSNIFYKGKSYGQYKIKRNLKRALYYSKKACRLNSAIGCQQVGKQYHRGWGTTKDKKKACKYLNRSCWLSPPRYKGIFCNNHNDVLQPACMIRKAPDRYPYKLMAKQEKIKRSCFSQTNKDKVSRSELCALYGYMFQFGKGLNKDAKQACRYYQQACRLEPLYCNAANYQHKPPCNPVGKE